MHTFLTARLNENWDISLNAAGQIALVRDSEAVVQAVCNECRLFKHDAYFRYEDGINWFETALGKRVNEALIKNEIRKQAEGVNGVLEVVEITISALDSKTRTLKANIELITEWGENVRFSI